MLGHLSLGGENDGQDREPRHVESAVPAFNPPPQGNHIGAHPTPAPVRNVMFANPVHVNNQGNPAPTVSPTLPRNNIGANPTPANNIYSHPTPRIVHPPIQHTRPHHAQQQIPNNRNIAPGVHVGHPRTPQPMGSHSVNGVNRHGVHGTQIGSGAYPMHGITQQRHGINQPGILEGPYQGFRGSGKKGHFFRELGSTRKYSKGAREQAKSKKARTDTT